MSTLQKYRICLSSNTEIVERVRAEIEKNGGYCPKTREYTDDHKCICKEFWEQDSEGSCKCGLYIKTLQYD